MTFFVDVSLAKKEFHVLLHTGQTVSDDGPVQEDVLVFRNWLES
jgi:hypothetical protein